MGFGASVAGGCSIGDGLVETATVTWEGWIALASMIVGGLSMSHFIFVRPMKKVHQQSAKVKQQTQIV
ncbi:YeeE/YedE family protein, partial [Pseudomonas sp. MOB-449]|nr:YeeE/YedE family protein [Pseudomonas sp. MOB-449]